MRIKQLAVTLLHFSLSASFTSAQEAATDGALDDNPSFSEAYDDPLGENEPTRRYIVKYKHGSKELDERMNHARRKLSSSNLRRTESQDDTFLTYGSFIPEDDAEVVYLNSEEEVKEWEEKDDVELVEPDSKVYPLTTDIPSWTHEHIPFGIDQVRAFNVSDEYISNRKICIIDSGYNLGHVDLQTENVQGYEGELSAAGDWRKDGSAHGTHVAGTIAGLGGNGKGVVGVIRNGKANLHIVKVFNDYGRWAWRSWLVVAVEECVKAGSNVINMSLGGPMRSEFEASVYERVFKEDGVLPVASAGNGRGGLGLYSYPAAYENVMAVAATTETYEIAHFSTRHDQVNIAAPGYHVWSTVPKREEGDPRWKKYSGTSMASPHVAGVAALVWSHDTTKSATYIRNLLQFTADDLGAPGRDDLFGHGFIRADKALAMLKDDSGKTFPPTPSPTKRRPGYCNHNPSGCDGVPTGGEFCQALRYNCVGECEGNWCTAESSGYCSPKKNECNGEFWSGWCGDNEQQCSSCGGQWCWNEKNPTSSPTMAPTTSLNPSATPSRSLMPSFVTSTPSMQPSFTSMPSDEPTQHPTLDPTPAPTEEIDGYCNYNGCNGLASGGSYCNQDRRKCTKLCDGSWCPKQSDGYCTKKSTGCDGNAWTGYCSGGPNKCEGCGGVWCYNEINGPPTSAPTSSAPTTKAPTMPTPSPTDAPTGTLPTEYPTSNPTDTPTRTPTAQPTSCSDNPDDVFFIKLLDGEPKYMTCGKLAGLVGVNDARHNNLCTKKIDSYNGVGPAKEVCKETCGTCPTQSPSISPTKEPSMSPSETVSNNPSTTASVAPSDAPSTSSAPTAAPTEAAKPCCSQNYKTCMDQSTTWCHESSSNCNTCGGVFMVPPKEECIARYVSCNDNEDGCCSPGTCQGDGYKQCL